jgi:hypothetical protein
VRHGNSDGDAGKRRHARGNHISRRDYLFVGYLHNRHIEVLAVNTFFVVTPTAANVP